MGSMNMGGGQKTGSLKAPQQMSQQQAQAGLQPSFMNFGGVQGGQSHNPQRQPVQNPAGQMENFGGNGIKDLIAKMREQQAKVQAASPKNRLAGLIEENQQKKAAEAAAADKGQGGGLDRLSGMGGLAGLLAFAGKNRGGLPSQGGRNRGLSGLLDRAR